LSCVSNVAIKIIVRTAVV